MFVPALALIGVPTAVQCLQLLAPVAGILVLRWIVRNADALIHKLFPSLAWHRQLGWLNIRSERRAARVLRGISLCFYVALAVALYGIVWSVAGLAQLPTEGAALNAFLFLPVLLISLGFWVGYLAWELIPKLRREYEAEDLERFRAESSPAQAEGQDSGEGARTFVGAPVDTESLRQVKSRR